MPGEMRRVAKFLDIAIDEKRWPAIVEHCTFDYMKSHAVHAAPLGGAFWQGGASTFINKGTNGRWHDQLTAEANQCIGQEAAFLGATNVSFTVDNTLPPTEDAVYPVPIVSTTDGPPISASQGN